MIAPTDIPVKRPLLAEKSSAYLTYLERWLPDRPSRTWSEVIADAGGPEKVAIVSVDLIVGFCHQGPLASPRVAAILPRVRELLASAKQAGITHIVATQDTHRPDAEEFAAYPPHCIAGSSESEMVVELASLPFADTIVTVEKNSISSVIASGFSDWESTVGDIRTYVIVGDCTDLCVYQAAMALKTRSNTEHRGQRVIVPVDCVATYDLPLDTATDIGAEPHDGDLLHHVFLHSMAQNGVDIVSEIR